MQGQHPQTRSTVLALALFTPLLLTALPTRANADLIAYWKADGNTLDSSGNGHTATLNGAAGYEPGEFGQAFSIPGSGYISAAPSTDWGFGTNPFTVSVWANFQGYNGGGPGALGNTLIGQDAGGGSTDKWVFYVLSSGQLGFHINGPDAGGIVFLGSPMSVTPVTNAWNMYTITRSGDTYTFYYDGASLGTATSSLVVPYSGTDLTMGEAEGIGQINGGLDDIRIYNTALSASQVRALAAPEPSPAVFLAFAIPVLLRRRRRS